MVRKDQPNGSSSGSGDEESEGFDLITNSGNTMKEIADRSKELKKRKNGRNTTNMERRERRERKLDHITKKKKLARVAEREKINQLAKTARDKRRPGMVTVRTKEEK